MGKDFKIGLSTFQLIFGLLGPKYSQKSTLLTKLPSWYPWFGHVGGQKSRFLDFLKVVLGMFRSCLGIIFGLKRPTFKCIFSSKGRYMTSKIHILGQNLGFQGKKRCLNHSQTTQTNFEKVQKIIFLTPKMVKNEPSKPPKRSILAPNLAVWEGHFDHFQGQKTRFFGLFESYFGDVQKLFRHYFWP